MNLLRFALPTLLLATLFTAGCADDAEPTPEDSARIGICGTDEIDRPDFDHIELHPIVVQAPERNPLQQGPVVEPALNGDNSNSPGIFGHAEFDYEFGLEACECADATCMTDWINENLGCGVCANIACGDGFAGGCVACPTVLGEVDDIEDEQLPTLESCVLPPTSGIPGL